MDASKHTHQMILEYKKWVCLCVALDVHTRQTRVSLSLRGAYYSAFPLLTVVKTPSPIQQLNAHTSLPPNENIIKATWPMAFSWQALIQQDRLHNHRWSQSDWPIIWQARGQRSKAITRNAVQGFLPAQTIHSTLVCNGTNVVFTYCSLCVGGHIMLL